MYSGIKNKTLQALNNLSTQVIFIIHFILNEMYPLIKNKVSQLLNNPNARLVLIFLLVLIVLTIGSGSDVSGG